MYMTEKQKKLLKRYIKKVLLEAVVLKIKSPGESTLTYELQKGINKPYPIGVQEMEKIKEAIRFRYPSMNSFDAKEISNTDPKKYTEISFETSGSTTNFRFVIRKVINPQNTSQYKYVMWYVPFNQREDIDKPGAVEKKEGSPFDKNVNIPNFLSDIYEFFIQALLMNN